MAAKTRANVVCGAVLAVLSATVAVHPAPAGAQTVQDVIERLAPGRGAPRATRGLRDPQQLPPTGARPSPLDATTAPAGTPAVAFQLRFPTGSAVLTPDAKRVLATLGSALGSSRLAGYRFRIEGHTDTVGGPELNKGLSERRATAVRDYLVAHQGISPGRLDVVGLGETQLLVQTPDETAEARNRRVQVVNLGG